MMANKKPWLDGPTAKDRATDKIWQGGIFFLIGIISSAGTFFLLGIVWIWTILIAIAGFFWLVTGLITYMTGRE